MVYYNYRTMSYEKDKYKIHSSSVTYRMLQMELFLQFTISLNLYM